MSERSSGWLWIVVVGVITTQVIFTIWKGGL